jgi:hypothetical protein
VRYLESIIWDKWMNVDTAHFDSYNKLMQGLKGDSHPFQSCAHYTVRSAIKMVKPTPDDTVIILGCAKGRPVCHFARLKVKKVIGIEIIPELSKIAEMNASKLRGRKAPIEIKNIDAALADYSEGSIFYMPNPFGEKTLRSVLSKIELSHKKNRKPLTIIYVIPQFAKVFEDFPWLKKTQDVNRFTGLRTIIYKTKY